VEAVDGALVETLLPLLKHSMNLRRSLRTTSSGGYELSGGADAGEWTCDIAPGVNVETLRAAYRIAKAAVDVQSSDELVMNALMALRSRTASRKQDSEDVSARAKMYVTELTRFPPDVVVEAGKQLGRTQTFFPALAEIVTACEALVAKRRAILAAIERAGKANKPAPVTVDRRDSDDPVWQEWMKDFLAGNHVTFEEFKEARK